MAIVELTGARAANEIDDAIALERRPDTRVIFVSGYAEDSIAESQARIPNAVFLPKPFSLSGLTATVQAQEQIERARKELADDESKHAVSHIASVGKSQPRHRA
mgnify:CR=1 FL=1